MQVAKERKSVPQSPKPRVSKADSMQLFLDSTIRLIAKKPIPDITLHDIADDAGLNHGYVFRYFGTRLDLFFAVTEELARLAENAVSTEIEKRNSDRATILPLDLSIVALGRPFTLQRQAIIQYLVTSGVDPLRFSESSRKANVFFAQQLTTVGMSERMAMTQATILGILLWAENSVASIFGVTEDEKNDIQALSFDIILNAQDAEKRLGWN